MACLARGAQARPKLANIYIRGQRKLVVIYENGERKTLEPNRNHLVDLLLCHLVARVCGLTKSPSDPTTAFSIRLLLAALFVRGVRLDLNLSASIGECVISIFGPLCNKILRSSMCFKCSGDAAGFKLPKPFRILLPRGSSLFECVTFKLELTAWNSASSEHLSNGKRCPRDCCKCFERTQSPYMAIVMEIQRRVGGLAPPVIIAPERKFSSGSNNTSEDKSGRVCCPRGACKLGQNIPMTNVGALSECVVDYHVIILTQSCLCLAGGVVA